MTARYELSGVLVESDLPFPSVPALAAKGTVACSVRLGDTLPFPPPSSQLELRGRTGEPPLICIGRHPRGYFLRVNGWADFWIERGGASVLAIPLDDCPLETLGQVFLDQVFPLVLRAHGRCCLHASSVAFDRRGVVAFLGRSGVGKSTLASSVVRSASARLFTDDCLAITVAGSDLVGHASYPCSRLWPKSARALFPDEGELPLASGRSDKRRARLGRASSSPLHLHRIYLLGFSDSTPVITRLRARDAFAALVEHVYRLDVEDRGHLAEEFAILEQVVRRVPVARLDYRRDFNGLPLVHQAISADDSD